MLSGSPCQFGRRLAPGGNILCYASAHYVNRIFPDICAGLRGEEFNRVLRRRSVKTRFDRLRFVYKTSAGNTQSTVHTGTHPTHKHAHSNVCQLLPAGHALAAGVLSPL